MAVSDPTLAAQRLVFALIAAGALSGTLTLPPDAPIALSGTLTLPPDAPIALDGVELCAALDRGVMRGGTCDADEATTTRARRAVGQPPCWTTASADRLTDVPGVGARTARTLIAFRNAGGRPEVDALAALPGIGERTAEAIAAGVSTRCEALPASD